MSVDGDSRESSARQFLDTVHLPKRVRAIERGDEKTAAVHLPAWRGSTELTCQPRQRTMSSTAPAPAQGAEASATQQAVEQVALRQQEAEEIFLRAGTSPPCDGASSPCALPCTTGPIPLSLFPLADTSGDGYIDESELLLVIMELVHDMDPPISESVVSGYLRNHTPTPKAEQGLDFDEFVGCYNGLLQARASGELYVVLEKLEALEHLDARRVFF